jgi:hypothetical protein
MALETAAALEETRKQQTGDDKYAAKGLFMFVLHGPTGKGPFAPGQSRIQFPLVINPESFNYSLPFAANLTALQEGGVTAEENGVVIGEISMEGTTGFKLRQALADTSMRRGDGEFTSDLDPGGRNQLGNTTQAFPLSGHMHFWRLANRCFDGYSALKKNPVTASQTRMEFHSLKDDLHLLVVPRSFDLVRSAGRERVTYRYSIKLAVVGAAQETAVRVPSPDRKMLDRFQNAVAKMRVAVQNGQAAIDDLRASQDEIRRTISATAAVLDDCANVFTAVDDVLNGTASLMKFPLNFVTSLANLAETAAGVADPAKGEGWRGVAASFAALADNLDVVVVASRDTWKNTFHATVNNYEDQTTHGSGGPLAFNPGLAALSRKLKGDADAGQGHMSVAAAFGGPALPGDVQRAGADPVESEPRFQPNQFQGFQEVMVSQGDTIQSLAARYIGNPNQWSSIVVANSLRAPYVTAGTRLPGTVAPGDSIMIPIPDALSNPDTLTTGNPGTGGSQIEALLGVDFERHQNANGQFGWAIDTAGGSTDVRKVRGVANLEQALDGRLRTTEGENILYPQFGMPRLVGNRALGDDIVNTRYLIRRQFLADRRVERVVSLRFLTDNDALEIEADVQPVGFTSTRTIARTLT